MSSHTRDAKERHPYYIGALPTNKDKIKTRPTMDNFTIPKHPSSTIISGSSGSGKSNLLICLLTKKEFYKDYFDLIFVFSNTADGIDDMYDNAGIPEEHMFKPDKQGLKQINHILKTQEKIIKKHGLPKAPKILMIMDDMAHENEFLKSKTFLKLHIMNRHFGVSVISLFQSYMKAPRSCRMQISCLFYFKGKITESEKISDEHCPSGYHHKEFMQMIQHATKEPYAFLYINNKAPYAERYRRCLTHIMELNRS